MWLLVVIRTALSNSPDAALRGSADAETDTEDRVSLTATARSIPGTLRQDILIDGRHHLTTEAAEHIGGEGTAPSPHELFPAALAACVAMTLTIYARTKEWDLGQVTVDVDYDHESTPRRFDIDVHFTAELNKEQRARLSKVAAACPVRRSIESGIEFEEHLECRSSFSLRAAS
jgi:putative redox protein